MVYLTSSSAASIRGGESVSWENATTVPHFAAKHRVELYLQDKTRDTRTKWTILRPVGFMEDYSPDFFRKMMAGLWATMPTAKKMQLVSVKDIGIVAASVLTDMRRWEGKAVGRGRANCNAVHVTRNVLTSYVQTIFLDYSWVVTRFRGNVL
jgi:uncharacterized protein YbjT (DUF2867 family)